MKHILSSHDLLSNAESLFDFADKAKSVVGSGKNLSLLSGKILQTLFYDPSTRERSGLETAMYRLGGHVVSIENARNSTEDIHGESLEDVVATLSDYSDAIALKHPEPGAAVRASKVSSCPILNFGDGNNENPIQALQDLYTIKRARPDAKTVMFIGDIVNSAVVTSFVRMADYFDLHVFMTGNYRPQQLPPGNHTSISEANLGAYINQADVVYLLGNKVGGTSKFKFTLDYISATKEDAIIMHPLPRKKELPVEIDESSKAFYYEQSKNGLFIRMAVLNWILGK